MSMPKTMFKTTIVVWSTFDPRETETEMSDLVKESETGSEAYCPAHTTKEVKRYKSDKDWDGTEFFGVDE